MEPKPGYVYYITEDYFKEIKDPFLMRNKKNGRGRPFYCCKKSRRTGLYWMIPLSSQKGKYQKAYTKNVLKYGNCPTIVLHHYAARDTAFVIQNAFPVRSKYIENILTVQEKPLLVPCSIQRKINSNFEKCMAIHRNGHKIFFTDIDKAQYVMQHQK